MLLVVWCLLVVYLIFFFFKQKTAYEMRISDWSSDVCSSDLIKGTDHDAGGGSADDAERRYAVQPREREGRFSASGGRRDPRQRDGDRRQRRDRKSVV